MKKCIFFIILILHSFLFSQIFYNFSQTETPIYSFQMNGTGSLAYPGIQEENFKISVNGNFKIEYIDFKDDIYTIKLIPFKTVVKIGEGIIENLSNSDNESSVISTQLIKMKKNGEIIETEELKKGLISLSQLLSLLPAFPNDLKEGKKWKQKIPAIEFPGIPMCELEFEYIYEKKDLFSNIKIMANQNINETRKQENMKIIFSGKNTSKGFFKFNEKEGKIENFNGEFFLNLGIKYDIPSQPEKRTETFGMKILLNLKVALILLNSQKQ
ncbi:MAG: hypothetical protein NC926_00520 [Candidatus Omnitrophica bacterium]|nr:hypothetical protein [Candidatus Omnitrophota bacterium]MCM8806434.1 hypothetical protein [Candidatus Omnitrophota bacterium]